MTRICSLPHLLAFEAAARTESFTFAAKELCLTPGAVSRHIRNLEDKLGGELFSRGHKKVELTERGKIFALSCWKVLDELAKAENNFREQPENQQINVSCLPTFAMHWLNPRLTDFYRACPDIHINVSTSTGLVAAGTDIALRRDPAHFPDMKAIPFLDEWSALVSSPDYLSGNELTGRTQLHIRARADLWEKWSAGQLPSPENITRHTYLDHTFAAIQAAEDGLGIALVPLLFCGKQLTGGRLAVVQSCGILNTGTYYVILQKKETPAIREFMAWLQKQAEPGSNEAGHSC